MSDRHPVAVCEEFALEQLAATARTLAEGLVLAAQQSGSSPQRRSRLELVGAQDGRGGREENLSNLARCYLRARRLRDGLFPERIFADAAWDILLELYACKAEGKQIGVSSACLAASVPSTTALRCLDRLEDCGLIERHPDCVDHRRMRVELTEIATWRIELWLNTTFNQQPQSS